MTCALLYKVSEKISGPVNQTTSQAALTNCQQCAEINIVESLVKLSVLFLVQPQLVGEVNAILQLPCVC